MRWVLVIPIALMIIYFILLRPIAIHLGYQIEYKERACLKALEIVRRYGYRLLLKGSPVFERCSSSGVVHCLIIPGTEPLGFVVGRG